jgi:large subunit ribosomal protein L30
LPSRKLKVTLMRSRIGLKPGHVRTLEALGLRRIRASVVHDDTPVIRGMIARVPYAVRVEPAESDAASGGSRRGQTKERSA